MLVGHWRKGRENISHNPLRGFAQKKRRERKLAAS
jgi:hypothetical protein